jgi:hypothetical protein
MSKEEKTFVVVVNYPSLKGGVCESKLYVDQTQRKLRYSRIYSYLRMLHQSQALRLVVKQV